MKKVFVLLLIGFLTLQVSAQEYLVPLQQAPRSCVSATKADPRPVVLPFFDDFSSYTGAPNPQLWLNADAYVNQDYAILPPTIGMVTLDALDAQGALHATATTSPFSADTLLSQPIRLDSLFTPVRRRLQPSDSIYLSFYYVPGGSTGNPWELMGDCPDEGDSLFLEFYNPSTQKWVVVWSIGGISQDSLLAQTGELWQFVGIPIVNTDYLSAQFQFRFRNYASLDVNPKPGISANCDQWNLDYIHIGTGRRKNERIARDVAFVSKAPSLLLHYQAMPARQFRAADMVDACSLTITNLYSQPLASSYQYNIYNESGSRIHHYDGGHENVPAYYPNHTYQTAVAHAFPSVNFVYPVSNRQQAFVVEHIVTEGVSGDGRRANDTIRFCQKFADYYAYDDGVPENGYGLSSTSSKIFIANRFVLNTPDTLTALDLYFNQTRNHENAGIKFYICVWANRDGQPGSLLLRDEVRQSVSFDGLNKYVRYKLKNGFRVSDTIFVGIEQQGNAYLNLGFDRSNDTRQHIYYRTGSSWQQSILSGSLMLRPCFGISATADIERAQTSQCRIYPNPTQGILNIETSNEEGATYRLYNVRGILVRQGDIKPSINLENLPRGLYLLQIYYANAQPSIHKIMLQ